MARPRSDDKRKAILDAAVRVVASQGLGAPTSLMAREAGVSNGTLFLYFETKADLFNQLYLELKTEVSQFFLPPGPLEDDRRSQLAHLWSRSLDWAVAFPDKRKALARLAVSDEITPTSREAGAVLMEKFETFVKACAAGGPLKNAPVKLVASLINALLEATLDYLPQDPDHAEEHKATSFEALWHLLT